MSAVSSVGADPGLYQFIQQLGQQGGISAATPTSPTDAPTATDASQSGQQSGQAVGGAGHHHHGHGGVFKQIESAVTSALQSAQADGNTDPNKVIQDAIAKVFQQNGVSASSSGGAQKPAGADPDGDGDIHTPGQSESTGDSAHPAFLQTLQSLGVDPQQFHADFLAAVQDAQNGQVDPATAMQSFPPGSNLDTIA